MERQELENLGLTKDQINEVLKLHKGSLNNNFIPKYRFDEINTELKNLKNSLIERDERISSLKALGESNDKLKERVQQLESKNLEMDNNFKKMLVEEKKKHAVKNEINKNRPYDIDMVFNLIKFDDVELDEVGNIKTGLENQIKELKEKKSFLFKNNDEKSEGNFYSNKSYNNISGDAPNNSNNLNSENVNNKSMKGFGSELARLTNSMLLGKEK